MKARESTEERLDKLDREVRAQARRDLAKSQIINFRLDPDNVMRLFEVADRKRKALGPMIREWVLERLDQEQEEASLATKTKLSGHELVEVREALRRYTTSDERLGELEKRVNALEKRIEKARQ